MHYLNSSMFRNVKYYSRYRLYRFIYPFLNIRWTRFQFFDRQPLAPLVPRGEQNVSMRAKSFFHNWKSRGGWPSFSPIFKNKERGCWEEGQREKLKWKSLSLVRTNVFVGIKQNSTLDYVTWVQLESCR